MNKKSLLLLLVGCGSAAFGAQQYKSWSLTVQPYVTYIDYSNSKYKNWGYSATLYGALSLSFGKHLFEGAVGTTHLDYKDGYTNWNQSDYTFAYTNYVLFPWYGKVGFHYITTPNTHFSDDGKIYFGDIGYISRYRWDAGLFLSYSDYRRDIDATEARFHGGFYRWLDYWRGFYFSGDITGIHINGKNQLGVSKKNYLSVGVGATYFTARYKVGAQLWAGQRTLMVDNGGFVVYNLRERYRGGVKLNGTYYLRKNIWLNAEVGYDNYKELSPSNKSVNVVSATVSIGYAF